MSQEEANRIARAVQRVRRSRNAGLKFALPTAAVLGAGAAVAIGSIPSGNGTITGCYLTDTANHPGLRYGQLRVIDPSVTSPAGAGPTETNSCFPDEQTITWNQRGPQGPQGPAGAKGATGAPLIGETTFGLKNDGGKTFLKLDGVKGESLDKAHKGEIDIESFSLSAGTQGSSGGGGGAGKTISSFSITKQLDKSSPLLFKAAATGQHLKLATLAFAKKSKGKQHDYLVFKFNDVLISSVQDVNGQGGKLPLEHVTFNFHKATESFMGTDHKVIQKIAINISAQN